MDCPNARESLVYLATLVIVSLYYLGAGDVYVLSGFGLLLLGILSRNIRSNNRFSEKKELRSVIRVKSGMELLIKSIIIASSIYVVFFLVRLYALEGINVVFEAYSTYPVNRDVLYWYRHSYFNGTLEFVYLALMGVCVYDCRYGLLGWRMFSLSALGMTILGLTEAVVLARYYYPAMGIAILICLERIGRSYNRLKALSVVLILTTLIVLSYSGRTFLSRHSGSPFTDRSTMYEGVEIRDSPGTMITSFGFKNDLTLEEYKRVRRDWNKPLVPPNISNKEVIKDFGCNAAVGPIVDQKLCSKEMQVWLRSVYQGYYWGTFGPVLPTQKYWEFANNILRLAIGLNAAFLVVPLVLAVSLKSGVADNVMLLLSPYWVTRVVSFFRGDPLHAGLSMIWIYSAVAMVVFIVSRVNGSAVNEQ